MKKLGYGKELCARDKSQCLELGPVCLDDTNSLSQRSGIFESLPQALDPEPDACR